jgi:serum/glucocorticoid-regulated kinase 2
VRTDDLESVRVERAIKRVRSDLAAHMGTSKDAHGPSAVQSENENGHGQEQKPENDELRKEPVDVVGGALTETVVNGLDNHVNGAHSTVESSDNVHVTHLSNSTPSKHQDLDRVTTDVTVPNGSVGDSAAPSTPDTPLSRIHRSQCVTVDGEETGGAVCPE